jgi:hypothetical protein
MTTRSSRRYPSQADVAAPASTTVRLLEPSEVADPAPRGQQRLSLAGRVVGEQEVRGHVRVEIPFRFRAGQAPGVARLVDVLRIAFR